jgi:hypothetical protein
LGKRQTITVEEANFKRYQKLAGKMLIGGKGDLSFTRYVNTCLSILSEVTLDQIMAELKTKEKVTQS